MYFLFSFVIIIIFLLTIKKELKKEPVFAYANLTDERSEI